MASWHTHIYIKLVFPYQFKHVKKMTIRSTIFWNIFFVLTNAELKVISKKEGQNIILGGYR